MKMTTEQHINEATSCGAKLMTQTISFHVPIHATNATIRSTLNNALRTINVHNLICNGIKNVLENI